MTTTLEPHARVRLICDPTRIGTLTDKTRPGRRGRGVRYQVQFPDGNRYISEDDIEPVPFEREDPLELLERGQIGQAQDMRRVLTHVRLTGRLADVIYSMETTNTDFYTYQFKPVLRFLNSPSNALLIADEVGLGKTIEAGLIWTELRSRFDLRRLLVVCPAMLREKWRSELTRRFGVRAEVLNAAGVLNRLRSPEQTMHGFAMICSMEGLRPPRDRNRDGAARSAPAELADVLRQSREQDDNPLIDLLVIDEAHYLRNPRTQSNELGRLLQSVAEHLLLLTATPIHNHNRDLFTMLHLLDPNTFEREEDLRLTLQAAQPLIQAREQVLKSTPSPQNLTALLRSAASHPQLRGNRELDYVMQLLRKDSQLSKRAKRADLANRLEMVNPLAHVITRTRKRDVKEWRVVRKPCRESVPMKPCEEAFYEAVTERVIDYAQPRDVSERFLLATPQRQMSSSMPATLRAWRKRRENFDELAAAGSEGADELGPLTREMIECVDDLGSVEQLIKHDSKYDRVRTILNQFLRENPGEKTVLFSSFRETLSYLGERLSEDGIPNIVMHGGVAESKDDILDRFRNEPEVRVLLSSEVGSEGIDLQFCRVLVNYDLPWNPMRVEQRIGRLDRLGQKADSILIWNLFYAETIDARIYTRLYEKLDLCRQALGDFEEVLGNEVRKLGIDLLTHHFTPEQQKARIDQTAQAMANVKHEQEKLEDEASHLVAYDDYILNQIHAARDMGRRITGEMLRTYVLDFFGMHYAGCTFRQINGEDMEFEVKLSAKAKQDLEDFIRSEKLATPTRLTRSSTRPVRCRFESRTTVDDGSSVEVISQFHPLVRFVGKMISEREEQLRPAVGVRLSAETLGEPSLPKGEYVLAAAQWSVKGLRSTEKLVFAAARLDTDAPILAAAEAERLANACALHGTDWFESRGEVALKAAASVADQRLFAQLEDDYDAFVSEIERQNNDRADLRLTNLRRELKRQLSREYEVREKHRSHGRESLVKATDGRIKALEGRAERKKIKIERARTVRPNRDEILVAVIRVD